jgi:outer membrane protein assembly factor BamB
MEFYFVIPDLRLPPSGSVGLAVVMARRRDARRDDHDRDEQPVLEIQVLSDVVPLDGVDVASGISASPDGQQWWDEDEEPPVPLGRPVVASTLTGLGVAGAVVAGALPWSGDRDLPAMHQLATGQSWLVWLLFAVASAVVLGILALARPRRGLRWTGAVAALAAAGLSGWAVVGLPEDADIGIGPGLACAALTVLAAGQLTAALSGVAAPGWHWRPAGIATAVVAGVLALAAVGTSGVATARDVDATTAAAPLVALSGRAPSALDSTVWSSRAQAYSVAGSVALVVGQATRGDTSLPGIAVLDLRTGVERWHHYQRGWRVRDATLTEDGSTALVVVETDADTEAIGFDVATGDIRWRERIASAINCRAPSPDEIAPIGNCAGEMVTGDGLLYQQGIPTDGILRVTYLNGKDGRRWQVRLGQGCRLRGAGGDAGGVYVLTQCVSAGFPDAHLLSETAVAYTLTGHVRWRSPLALVKGTVAGLTGPVFVRSDVAFVQQEQRYVALDTRTGRQLWTSTDSFEPDTTVTDGTYLAWSTGIEVAVLDLHAGTMLWQHAWQFPEEADLPLLTDGRLYLIRHTIGPNPYTCAEHATLLTLDAATGTLAPGRRLPGGAGNDCGPNVEDRSFLRGSLLVLTTANTVTVLAGH